MKTPTINSRVVKLEVLKGTATRASVNAVESRTTSLEGDVATAQSDISTLQTDVSTLQTDVSAAEGDISTLQGNVATLTQGIVDAVSTHNTAPDSHADIRTLVAGKQDSLTISAVGTALLNLSTPAAAQIPRINADASVTLIDAPSNVEEVDANFVSITYNPGGGGGGSLSVSESGPPALTSATLTWSANGDASGAMYFLGALGGTWVNPHSGGQVTVVRSATYNIAAMNFVNRDTEYGYGSGIGCFAGVDLGSGRSMRPNVYTVRNYTSADRYMRNWVFEGTNTVSANTEAGWNAATWTALDTRSGDTTMSSTAIWKYELTQPATAYRYLRWRLTGNDSLNGAYLALTEFELYGTLNGSFQLPLPAWATGWLTDGTNYIPGRW